MFVPCSSYPYRAKQDKVTNLLDVLSKHLDEVEGVLGLFLCVGKAVDALEKGVSELNCEY